jgi:hypothetical protein
MLSLAAMLPVWILSLSVFYFTVSLHRFQQGFDLLTPSVVHRYLSYRMVGEEIVPYMEPMTMALGIQDFFTKTFADHGHPYMLALDYFTSNQTDPCVQYCQGVAVELKFEIHLMTVRLTRHYQLLHHV